MRQKNILSSDYNMSPGFLPVIVTCLLCQFIAPRIAVYIGVGVGILYLLGWKKTKVPNFILYLSTGMLVLCSGATLISSFLSKETLPLILEAGTMTLACIFYLLAKRFIRSSRQKQETVELRHIRQGVESALIAGRILLMLGLLHLLIGSISSWFVRLSNETFAWWLFQIGPLTIFILTVIFNQIGISYFNKVMSPEYIPVVNEKGGVTGKMLLSEIPANKDLFTYPVIRIIISVHGRIFLGPYREIALNEGLIDTPLQSYLLFNETLEEGTDRIIKQKFPNVRGIAPIFSILYSFKSSVAKRLVYLYILDLEDDSLLKDEYLAGGKPWSLRQIEDNIGKGVLGECLEEEFEHLCHVIYIREKCKES